MQISININIIDQEEKWKTIAVAPDYEVSTFGNVKRIFKSKEKPVTQYINKQGYCFVQLCLNGIKKNYNVHRLVADAFIDVSNGKPIVDHVNGNKLDNHFLNLRRASIQQNNCNAKKTSRPTSSCYKGVSYDKKNNKWLAQIRACGKDVWIGRFTTEKAAARAYNVKARELHKEFAWLNNVSDDEEYESVESDEEVTIYNS